MGSSAISEGGGPPLRQHLYINKCGSACLTWHYNRRSLSIELTTSEFRAAEPTRRVSQTVAAVCSTMGEPRGMTVSAPAPALPCNVALCIGNSKYASSPLANAAHDAEDVAELCRSLGFDTTLLLEASLDDMLSALAAFVKKLRRGGVSLIFYAGAHATQPTQTLQETTRPKAQRTR